MVGNSGCLNDETMMADCRQSDEHLRLATLLDLAINQETHETDAVPMAFILQELARPASVLVDSQLLAQSSLNLLVSAPEEGTPELGDLLFAQQPSLDALLAMKAHWKAVRMADGERDHLVGATSLYYLAVAVARVRLRRRITTLKDNEVLDGLVWLFNQPWLAQPIDRVVDELLLTTPWPDAVN